MWYGNQLNSSDNNGTFVAFKAIDELALLVEILIKHAII